MRLSRFELALIATTVAAIVLFGAIDFTLSKVNHYEETRYHAEGNADGVDVYSFFLKAKEDCAVKKNATEKDRCHESVDGVIKRHIESRDLVAQETVALATRGLLWVGAIQAITSFLTLGFLGWTVYQTYLILEQSRAAATAADTTLIQANETTKLTSETLDVTKSSSALQLKPYLVIKFRKVKFGSSEFGRGNTVTLAITVDVTNKGKTPARTVITDFDSTNSRIEYKRPRGINGISLVPQTMQPLHEFLIGGDETVPLHFIVDCTSAVIGTQYGPESHEELRKEWVLAEVVLNGFNVRYKDIETESSTTHKLCKFTVEEDLIGTVPLAGKTRLYEYTTDDDKNHHYFKVYAASN